jgi:sortase A
VSTTLHDAPPPGPRPSRHRGDRVRTTVRGFGEAFITVGVVLLLFVVYQLYWTDVVSAGKQAGATTALEQTWAGGDNPIIAAPTGGQQRTSSHSVAQGDGFAKMYIPSFGADYQFTVLEGTDAGTLATGPGHYQGTAFPGEPGNFAVAGHRVGNGAPFNDLNLLRSCDAILTETATTWYVYRVLPMADEVTGWSAGRGGQDPSCTGADGEASPLTPLGGAYTGVVGREIVDPSTVEVIAPVPDNPGANPSNAHVVPMLTLTTCEPQFSARQRMIIHAVLVQTWHKDGSAQGTLPPELAKS